MVIAQMELRRKTQDQAQMLTEREAAAQTLAESEAIKTALQQTALVCIITINDQEQVLDWNPAAEKTFGYTQAEAQGSLLSSLIIPPSLRGAHKRGMAHFLATGEGPVLNQRIEVPALRKSGEEFPAELTVIPIRLKGQMLFTAYLRDISERKASEDLLHQAHERLEQAHASLAQANEDLERRVQERTALLEQANQDLREADAQRSEAAQKIIGLNTELMQAYDATIEGWSRALDLRDKETEGHCQRVTELTVRLARSLRLSEGEIVPIQRGALLHDIGKMGVPDQILLKPGPLTGDEWAVMRLHPTYAYEMLSPIDFLHSALTIPWCHHEKWDGTGYPRGLAGMDIPLAARLFAVADVWDALRSNRPYRAGWPPERVLEHLASLSGTHFDPQAVAAFLQMMAADWPVMAEGAGAWEHARRASADPEHSAFTRRLSGGAVLFCQQELQNHHVQPPAKLAESLAEAPDLLEAKACMQGEARRVFAVQPRHNRVKPERLRLGHQRPKQALSQSLPQPVWVNIHGVLRGKAVAAPGMKLAEAAPSHHLFPHHGDKHGQIVGVMLRKPCRALLHSLHSFLRRGRQMQDSIVVNMGDAAGIAHVRPAYDNLIAHWRILSMGQGRLLLRRAHILHAPDCARSVIGNHECAVLRGGDTDRTPPHMPVFCDKARQEVVKLTHGFACLHRRHNHLVTRRIGPVP